MWLQPVDGYVPLSFNRSGVIAAKAEDGSFIVRCVIDRSPAWVARMRTGDRVLTINDTPAKRFSGADFARLNAAQRTTMNFALLRGTATRRVSLILRDLLAAP